MTSGVSSSLLAAYLLALPPCHCPPADCSGGYPSTPPFLPPPTHPGGAGAQQAPRTARLGWTLVPQRERAGRYCRTEGEAEAHHPSPTHFPEFFLGCVTNSSPPALKVTEPKGLLATACPCCAALRVEGLPPPCPLPAVCLVLMSSVGTAYIARQRAGSAGKSRFGSSSLSGEGKLSLHGGLAGGLKTNERESAVAGVTAEVRGTRIAATERIQHGAEMGDKVGIEGDCVTDDPCGEGGGACASAEGAHTLGGERGKACSRNVRDAIAGDEGDWVQAGDGQGTLCQCLDQRTGREKSGWGRKIHMGVIKHTHGCEPGGCGTFPWAVAGAWPSPHD